MTESAISAELAENLTQFCTNRGRVYAFLARCYEKEIDATFAAELAGAEALESDNPLLVKAFAALQAAMAQIDDHELDELACIFNRVFFGMGPLNASKAFPYESVYTSQRGLMMQEAYAQVKLCYAKENFEKTADLTEPEDHIAVELAFMAALCKKAVTAIESNDAAALECLMIKQYGFLQSHLLNWVDRFVADVKISDPDNFYHNLAILTEAFLKADKEALTEVVE